MNVRAVLFDLFGTLVAPFRKREHEQAVAACAALLGIDPAACHRYWVDSFPHRIRGAYPTVADNFAWIAEQVDSRRRPATTLAAAEARYLDFTRESLCPVSGAVDLLRRLRAGGASIGLVTNCASDVPHVWAQSAFAPYVDVCAFSCAIGSVKPEPHIFRHALARLGAPAPQVLYVGDGSDQELTGAARCGMRPVLVTNDLSNTYDPHRADVAGWEGPTVSQLAELDTLLDEKI